MASINTDPPPFTEPVISPEVTVEGFELEMVGNSVHFIGWQFVSNMGSEGTEERRIVIRFCMDRPHAEGCCHNVHRALFGDKRH